MVSGPDLGQRSKAETSRWQVGIGVSLTVAGATSPPLGREGPLCLPCMLDVSDGLQWWSQKAFEWCALCCCPSFHSLLVVKWKSAATCGITKISPASMYLP